MTKLYEGGGIYTVHLASGKTLELTDDEINEIASDAGVVEKSQDGLQDHINTANMYEKTITKIKDLMDELD